MSFFQFYSSGAAAADPVAAFQNPYAWFDFRDAGSFTTSAVGYGSGVGVDAVANKGAAGAALDLVRAGGASITDEGGYGWCSGSQNNYQSGATGDYDFLHNGTGGHVFYIMEHDSTDTGENFLHISNISSSAAAGSRFTSQQTGDNNQYRSITGYGGGNLAHASAVGTLPENSFTIAELTIESDVILRDDAVELLSATAGGLLSADSHADSMRFLVSGAGKIKGILVFSRRLSDAERYAVYKKAASYYGLPALNVTLLLGDSNAGVQGAYADASAQYLGTVAGAYIYAHAGGNPANEQGFFPLDGDTTGVEVSTSNAGADLALMYHLNEASGEKEHLIKSYENGSDLFAKWNPTTYPELASGWDALAERIGAVKALAANMGRSINWRGACVMLGHNDASATFRADNYATNLANLFADLRGNTQAGLPIVCLNTSLEGFDTPDAGFTAATYQASVRAAVISVCDGDENAYAYQPVNAGLEAVAWNEASPNGVHYDMPTLEAIGREMADGLTATAAPSLSVAASIAGGTDVDDLLTFDAGAWANDLLELRIQWMLDGVDIAGATGWQHTATTAGDYAVRYSGANGTGESISHVTAAHSVTAAAPAFDPTTLGAGVALTRFNDAAIYQDAAGTIIANLGEPVGFVEDLTGNGLHFTQATASKRPILREDASGNRYLEFDNVDDAIGIATPAMAGTHQLGMAADFDTTSRAMSFVKASQGRYVGIYQNGQTSTTIIHGVVAAAPIRVNGASYIHGVMTRGDLYDTTRGKSTMILQFDTGVDYGGWVVGVGNYGASYGFDNKLYGLLGTADVVLADETLAEIEAWWQEAMQ